MQKFLIPVLLVASLAQAADTPIAIRVRGTVEVSPDRQAWTPLIRNLKLPEQGFARTLADSLGQVREGNTLTVLGPQTLVQREARGLRLDQGSVRLEGVGRLNTRLGVLETLEPDADLVVIDKGSAGLACEVYDGFVRISRPGAAAVDVDGCERADWTETSLTVRDSTMADVPMDLRLPPEE